MKTLLPDPVRQDCINLRRTHEGRQALNALFPLIDSLSTLNSVQITSVLYLLLAAIRGRSADVLDAIKQSQI